MGVAKKVKEITPPKSIHDTETASVASSVTGMTEGPTSGQNALQELLSKAMGRLEDDPKAKNIETTTRKKRRTVSSKMLFLDDNEGEATILSDYERTHGTKKGKEETSPKSMHDTE